MITEEIAQYLAANGCGLFNLISAGSTIFLSILPALPDDCIAIYARGGGPVGDVGGVSYDRPSVQIIVRGTQNAEAVHQRALDIFNWLHGFRNDAFVADGILVTSCQAVQSGPVYIGRDENGRHEYSLNFDLECRNDDRRNP